MMSVFCSNTLIFAPECWKCILRIQIFPETRACESRLCHEFVSFFSYSKAFAIYLKSYQNPCIVLQWNSKQHFHVTFDGKDKLF